MAVRNISSLGRTKPIPVFVWIPPSYSPIHKIEIYDGSSTYDVTDIMTKGEYSWGITGTIGKFEFVIDNSSQIYTDTFSLHNEVRVYMDYASTATTLRFKGKIERVSKKENTLVLTGRGPATKYMGKNVTYSATSTARSTILSNIISRYFNDLTTTNLEADTGISTVNYFDRPFWEVVEDICSQGSYSAYIDTDFDFHYFLEGSRKNTTEAVVHEYNLIETGDFSPDASFVYNKIKVYGVEIGGNLTLTSAEDVTSQNTYGIRELKIDDSSITTQTQLQARADYELSLNKDPPTIGTIISLGLPTLTPGEQLRISDPFNGLNPGYYDVFEFTHKFSNDEPFITEVTIKKERSTIPGILKDRLKFESRVTSINPHEMDYSWNFDFSTDTGTHSNTQIAGGVLSCTSSSGTWISEMREIDSPVTLVEARINGNNLTNAEVWLSIDGGIIFGQIGGPGTRESFEATGKKLQLKVNLFSSTSEVNGLALLYKK